MARLLRFFRIGLWAPKLEELSWVRRLGYTVLRIISYVVSIYDEHIVGLRAAGLALLTLLSFVPLLAIVFGVADGLGFREPLDEVLSDISSRSPQQFDGAITQVRELVSRTNFAALGWVSVVVLAAAGLTLFSRIEQSLNFAWRTNAQRGWVRRLTSFVTLVIVVPMALVAALFVRSAMASSAVVQWAGEHIPFAIELYDAGLWLVPWVIASLGFTIVYRFLPNAPVTWRSAVASGIFAGISVLGMHTIYVHFQIGAARANAIYATIAALPLFLVYLQLTWTLVLLGAEGGYAFQNLHLIGPGRDLGSMSAAMREQLATSLTNFACQDYAQGRGPLATAHAAARFDVPLEWIESVARDLTAGGVLVRTETGDVVPASPAPQLDLAMVRRATRGYVPLHVEDKLAVSDPLATAIREADRADLQRRKSTTFAVTSDRPGTAES